MATNNSPHKSWLNHHSHSMTALSEMKVGIAPGNMSLRSASQDNVTNCVDDEGTPVESTSPWDVIIKRELTVKSSPRESSLKSSPNSRHSPRLDIDKVRFLAESSNTRRGRSKIQQQTGSGLAFGSTPSLMVMERQQVKSTTSSESSGSKYSQDGIGQVCEQFGTSLVNWDFESSAESSVSHFQDSIWQQSEPNTVVLQPRNQCRTATQLDKDSSKTKRKTALDSNNHLLNELLALEREKYEYDYKQKANTQNSSNDEVVKDLNFVLQPLNLRDKSRRQGTSLKTESQYMANKTSRVPKNSVLPTPVSPVGTMESDYLLLPPVFLPERLEHNPDRYEPNDQKAALHRGHLNPLRRERPGRFYGFDKKYKLEKGSHSSTGTASSISILENSRLSFPQMPSIQMRNRNNRYRTSNQLDTTLFPSCHTQYAEESFRKRLSGIINRFSPLSLKKATSLPTSVHGAHHNDSSPSRYAPSTKHIQEVLTRAKQKMNIMSGDERRRTNLKKKITVIRLGNSPDDNGAWV